MPRLVSCCLDNLIKSNNIEAVRTLYKDKSPDTLVIHNIPVLLFAIQRNVDIEIVKIIVENLGVESIDYIGYTAIHHSIFYDRMDILEFLLENGGNPDGGSGLVKPPLYNAVQRRQTKAVELLLSYGADPDVTTEDGVTLLQLAIEGGMEGIEEILRINMQLNL